MVSNSVGAGKRSESVEEKVDDTANHAPSSSSSAEWPWSRQQEISSFASKPLGLPSRSNLKQKRHVRRDRNECFKANINNLPNIRNYRFSIVGISFSKRLPVPVVVSYRSRNQITRSKYCKRKCSNRRPACNSKAGPFYNFSKKVGSRQSNPIKEAIIYCETKLK